MSKKILLALIVLSLSPCQVPSFAEDFADCRARCAHELADCMNQPQASEPELEAAREAKCSQTSQQCNADCENLEPPSSESPRPPNSNIIYK